MEEKLTEELLNELMFTKSIHKFVEKEELMDTVSLPEYLGRLLTAKKLKRIKVIKESQLNQTFGYQIFSGERNPSRNKLIQLIFGMELNLKEAQRVLKYGGINELYPKSKRDAIIIFCINNGADLVETENELYSFGEQTICEE